MGRKISTTFSNANLSVSDVVQRHNDLEAAALAYFADPTNTFGLSLHEVASRRADCLQELEFGSVLTLLAALEALFRIDYLMRCKLKPRNDLSNALGKIFKARKERARLAEDILPAWKKHSSVKARDINDLIAAYEYRHWLAHGRYWAVTFVQPTFLDVAILATAFASLPFAHAASTPTSLR